MIEAEQLWLRVAKNTPMRREALDALSRIYRTNSDLPNLYRTLQRLHESSPAEPAAAANYARLALLLEQNAAEGHRVAKEAYDRAPTELNCAVTYAFSLYGLGRTSEGLEVIKKLPNDQLHDPHAAVYVASGARSIVSAFIWPASICGRIPRCMNGQLPNSLKLRRQELGIRL